MPAPIQVPNVEGLQQELKAGMVRGIASALKTLGRFDDVLALLSPRARALLMDPPPVTTWVRGDVNLEIVLAMEAVGGMEFVREASLLATRTSILPVLRPLVDGMLRLFGVGPAAIFRNLQRFTDQTSRGVEMEFQPADARSGTIVIRILGTPNIPPAAFVSMAGSLALAFELCKVSGEFGPPEIKRHARTTEARISTRW